MSYQPELTDDEKKEQDALACYREAAQRKQRDGELEIDANAIVSKGDDNGAYVQAWIWIRDDEAGFEYEDDDETEETPNQGVFIKDDDKNNRVGCVIVTCWCHVDPKPAGFQCTHCGCRVMDKEENR